MMCHEMSWSVMQGGAAVEESRRRPCCADGPGLRVCLAQWAMFVHIMFMNADIKPGRCARRRAAAAAWLDRLPWYPSIALSGGAQE